MNKKINDFLSGNPGSTKAQITEATAIKGLPLFNALKKMLADRNITSEGEKDDTKYTVVATDKPTVVFELGEDEADVEPAATSKRGAVRDNSKYKFNGELYGKSPLVRAVVAKYIEDNPDTTAKKLKEIFPDELMKPTRFGVFQSESEARKISGERPRYFLGEDQLIKVKGQKEPISVCNQWRAELMDGFLKVAKGLGYKIK